MPLPNQISDKIDSFRVYMLLFVQQLNNKGGFSDENSKDYCLAGFGSNDSSAF